MSQYAHVIDPLVSKWTREGIAGGPCSAEAIASFEQRENVVMPADLRAYWRALDGMKPGPKAARNVDGEGFSFWSLQRVTRLDRELAAYSPTTPGPEDAADFYAFADYLDWSWAYAIRLRGPESGRVLLIGTAAPRVVAATFMDFLELYLADAAALYPADQ
jgi:SMI1 / KNR4 family (SUKH-1)